MIRLVRNGRMVRCSLESAVQACLRMICLASTFFVNLATLAGLRILQGCQIAQWRLCGLNLMLPLASAAMCRLSIGADLFLFFHPQSESAMEE